MLNWDDTPSIAAMRHERAWIELDLEALAGNVQALRRYVGATTALMAVVKADAYGHGAVTVAEVVLAAGASWLGVATIPEGIELRAAGITAPILVLGATNTPEQFRAIAQWDLQPTLSSPEQVRMAAATMAIADCPLAVHLKLDTGMSRLGVPWGEALPLVQWIQSLPQLQLVSIYSHLATADGPDPQGMEEQRERFEGAIAQVRAGGLEIPRLHLANSAATLRDGALHYDLVRVGLALYGYYPAAFLRSVVVLKPVLGLKARITQLKTIGPGTGVSYGHRFVASQPMVIAVVGIGYADGVPRSLSNRLMVLVRGQRVPQVGTITMDQLMLDVSQIPEVEVGDVVTLLGRDGDGVLTADDWADTLGTISWEILCGFKHRLPRIALGCSNESLASVKGMPPQH